MTLYRIVLADLNPRNLRTVLTALGIVIGVASLVSLLAIGYGMRAAVRENLEGLVNMGFILMPSGGTPSGGLGLGSVSPMGVIPEGEIEGINEIYGVGLVTPVLTQVGFTRQTGDSALLVIGTPLSGLEKGLPGLIEGSYWTGDREAVLGATAAKMLSAKPGDRIEILKRPYDKEGLSVRVVGILSSTGTFLQDQAIYLPLETVQEFYGQEGVVNLVFVRVDDPEAAEAVREVLVERYPDLMIVETDQVMQNVGSILGILDAVLLGIGSISMLIAGLIITNSVMMSVNEKVREIGILKALGYTRGEILRIFIVEGLAYSAVGGPIGVAAGVLAAKFVSSALSVRGYALPLEFGPQSVVAGLAISLAVSLIASIPPARRAASMRVVEALSHE